MANIPHDKVFLTSRKQALKNMESLDRKYGAEIFRSACRKFLESTRAEDRLLKDIALAEKELLALRKKKNRA